MTSSAPPGSTSHLWRSCALVQLRPWLSVAAMSYALSFESLRYLQIFLSGRFSSPGDAANVSFPVIDALTIRDRKIKRLWLHGERASQNPRSADQIRRHRLQSALDFRIVASIEGVSASEMPGPAQDLPKGDQRCEASLLSISTDTWHDLQISKVLFVSVLRQRLVQ